MAKRVDHDSTMEVSSSQLVPGEVKRPVPHQAPGVSKNDVSMWIGGVVSADEFAGKPKKPASRKGLRIVLVSLLVAVVAGAGGYYMLGQKDTAALSAAPTAPADAMAVTTASDAAALDAAPVATAVDAGIDAGVGLQVDAISGLPEKPAAPAKKKVTKKVTKKPAVKKKPAPRR